MFECQCLGCGCLDSRACVNPDSGDSCFWLVSDELRGIGICSECEEHLERFNQALEMERDKFDQYLEELLTAFEKTSKSQLVEMPNEEMSDDEFVGRARSETNQ